ncbi:MAG TPA: flagellar biosynthetic protein FliR [Deltaproteobacteria bacterium]|nr:flagellar biosynthetic protein FliR [Deltaproteobacteria bacterium]
MNELLSLAWQDTLTFVFIFLRVGIIFAMIPFFSAELIPRRITAILAFFLSLVLVPMVPSPLIRAEDINVLTLLVFLLHEALIGMSLGLAVTIIFAGIQIAGEIAGFQMGFAIANVVDPMTGIDAPITSNVMYITAFLLFFAIGGEHMLIKALVESYYLIPLDASFPQRSFLLGCLAYGGQMFMIGVKVASPIIGVLLLINVAFAIIARALPQMNVFLMAFPLTIAVGLTFTTFVISLLPLFMSGALAKAWEFMISSLGMF